MPSWFSNEMISNGLLLGVWVSRKCLSSSRLSLTTNSIFIFRDGYMLLNSFSAMTGCCGPSHAYIVQAIPAAASSRAQWPCQAHKSAFNSKPIFWFVCSFYPFCDNIPLALGRWYTCTIHDWVVKTRLFSLLWPVMGLCSCHFPQNEEASLDKADSNTHIWALTAI